MFLLIFFPPPHLPCIFHSGRRFFYDLQCFVGEEGLKIRTKNGIRITGFRLGCCLPGFLALMEMVR